MKIGILTFHNAHNYGAALQAYALKKYLIKKGFEVECINYINKNIEEGYLFKRKNNIKIGGFRTTKKWIKRQIEISIGKKEYECRWKKFDSFIYNYLTRKDKFYNKKDESLNKYDIIICGSDQIWNNNLTNGFDDLYFANIKTKAKKIAYAASIGKAKFNKEEEKKFLKLIKNFNYISVRELNLKEYIEKNSQLKVNVVVDPTLLLEKEDYEPIFLKNRIEKEKYLLQYTMFEDKNIDEIAHAIAKENGLNIKEIRYSKNILKKGTGQLLDVGVEEFLSYINNAEYVVTNSYHGTIFSLLFNKNFYAVKNKGGNVRIENLLDLLNLEKRYIEKKEETDNQSFIDYDNVERKLIELKKESKSFLDRAINSNNGGDKTCI